MLGTRYIIQFSSILFTFLNSQFPRNQVRLQDVSPEPESRKGGPDVTRTMERTQWPSCQGVCLSNFTLRETQSAPERSPVSALFDSGGHFSSSLCPGSLSRPSKLRTPARTGLLLVITLRISWITFISKKRRHRQAQVSLFGRTVSKMNQIHRK